MTSEHDTAEKDGSTTSLQTEASQAFDELRDAAQSGAAALDKQMGEGTLTSATAKVPDSEEVVAKRRSHAVLMAQRRQRGRAEAGRAYAGVMTVGIKLELFDLSLASSAERFLGFIDKGIHVISRRGGMFIGQTATLKIMDRLQAMIEEFSKQAIAERDQVRVLVKAEREKVENEAFGEEAESLWIDPKYQAAPSLLELNVKHPLTTKVVQAIRAYDDVIGSLTTLSWNGCVDQSMIDDIRLKNFKGMMQIFKFTIDTTNSMYKKAGGEPGAE
jgi:hypothetical protein